MPIHASYEPSSISESACENMIVLSKNTSHHIAGSREPVRMAYDRSQGAIRASGEWCNEGRQDSALRDAEA
jgi:hypothetical protein